MMMLKLILVLFSCSGFVHISHGQTFSDITVEDGEPLVVGMTSTQFSVISSDGGGVHSISVYFNNAEVYKFTIVAKTVTPGSAASSSARFEYKSPTDSIAISDGNNIKITVAIKDIVAADNGVTTLQFRNSAGSASSNNLVFNVASCQTISNTAVTSSDSCTFGTYGCVSTFQCNTGFTLVNDSQSTRTCGKQAKWNDENICNVVTCDNSSLANKYPNITVIGSQQSFSYNDTATIECLAGFEKNSTSCTCSQTNSWICEEDIICQIVEVTTTAATTTVAKETHTQASSSVTSIDGVTTTGEGTGSTTEAIESNGLSTGAIIGIVIGVILVVVVIVLAILKTMKIAPFKKKEHKAGVAMSSIQ